MNRVISMEEKTSLKGMGFIPQRQEGYFACRIVTKDGTTNTNQTKKIAEIAEKYGRGYISYTTRLSIEIPWIEYENIENVIEELKEIGLFNGGTGAKIRPIVPCKGTVCKFGLSDTQELAREMHDKYYEGLRDVALPHKFKMGVGGCPNNCIKPALNDIGIMGQTKPLFDNDLCRGCKKCSVEMSCRVNAAKLENRVLEINSDKCINCGQCISYCNFNAIKPHEEGFKIFLGGKWGKSSKLGEPLEGIFSKDDMMSIVEKCIFYYKENGNKKERFGDMIDRIGFEEVQKTLLETETV
jgi:dissimilatory sulfite reductase (desulfoviridin) alpha/beta subunit